MLEDALVLGDGRAAAQLFDDGGVLVLDAVVHQGPNHGDVLAAVNRGYLAEPRRVIQTHDTALLLGNGVINVARRGGDGTWRYRIAVIEPNGADHD